MGDSSSRMQKSDTKQCMLLRLTRIQEMQGSIFLHTPLAHGSCQDSGLSWGLQGELCSEHTVVCRMQTSLLLQSKEMVAFVCVVIGILE